MSKYALTGHPLGHTMSPPIHKALFALSGKTDIPYDLYDINPDDFKERIKVLFEYSGFNITIPHKIAIISCLDRIDPTAARYGAVNTVKCGKQNIGYNTDVYGFLRSVSELGAELNANVAVLGCGGVGRMMAIETALAGGNLTLAVRESGIKAAKILIGEIRGLKPEAQLNIADISKLSGSFDLMINATPVGMYPDTGACPVADEALENIKYLFDAVYNPTDTVLVKKARARGIKSCSGMNMLVWQAAKAHEIWEGTSFKPADINMLVKEMETTLNGKKEL